VFAAQQLAIRSTHAQRIALATAPIGWQTSALIIGQAPHHGLRTHQCRTACQLQGYLQMVDGGGQLCLRLQRTQRWCGQAGQHCRDAQDCQQFDKGVATG
jgi:hypothetical protein